jgi:DNA-binding FadR family transcriptional regulator
MPKSTLHDDVLDVLGARLASLHYAAGTILKTDELESEFDVSRTVMREALKVLESMSLVEARRAHGITVLDADNWNVYDPRMIRWRLEGRARQQQLRSLTELRHAVEPFAASLAAAHASVDQSARLVELSAAMQVSGSRGDLEEFLAQDIEYHRLLLDASANDMLAKLGDVVAAVLTGRTVHRLMPRRPKASSLHLHALIAQSIASADARAAEDGMRALLSEVEGNFHRGQSEDGAPTRLA